MTLLKEIAIQFVGGLSMAVPMILIWAAIKFAEWRQRKVRPPQNEKLLRPPGHSLSRKWDEEVASFLMSALFACVASAFVPSTAETLGKLSGHRFLPASLVVGCIGVGIGLTVVFLTCQAFRAYQRADQVRLGLRGEQAVAEVLTGLQEVGFRAFHDIQPTGTWNIDHVLVGPQGVFVIETKARRKRPSRTGQQAHEVVYDGQSLAFPSGATDRNTIRQAQRNADWLADFLAKKTAEVTPVRPFVVLPGWFVTTKGDFAVKVMNTTYLSGFLRKQPEQLSEAQVRRVAAALDEKCRTVEF